jgi:hypothetical protein
VSLQLLSVIPLLPILQAGHVPAASGQSAPFAKFGQ